MSQFGGFSACLSLLTFFASFFWTRIADRYGIHRRILICTSILSSLAFSGLYISGLPPLGSMIFAGLYVLFGMAMPSLVDKIVLDDLTLRGVSKDLYAKQMLFILVSYGLVTLGISYFIQLFGYGVIFIFLAIFTICFVLFTLCYMTTPSKNSNPCMKEHDNAIASPIPEMGPGAHGEEGLLKHVLNLDYLFFLLVILANGVSRFFMSFFLNLYLTETVSMAPIQSALSAVIGLFFEILLFTKAKYFLDKIGIYWMLMLGQLAMVIRLWMYYVVPPKIEYLYVFFVIELLKGINMGFIQPSAVKLSSIYAPKRLEGTFQGIYFGVLSGLGGFFAGLYANLFLTDSNFKSLLYYIAIISTLMLFLYSLRYLVYEAFKGKQISSTRKDGYATSENKP